ncbi:hypothetical protein NDU88_008445 [Pleurodeles waltl]|uniref:Uncharacterized protein n=1 Tax=Pleurodeles waltl TaxID=8319 RepID=A0AAV7PS71_PLEWA|nr:hypothetical protein NDU88_008445 [Pleurodeles waltl]
MHCVDRPLLLTWETCILGLFPRGKKLKAMSHFLDLGLLMAKCLITRKWWYPEPATYEAWAQSLSVWVRAECVALRHEDVLGLRKDPLAAQWELMLADLCTPLVPVPARLWFPYYNQWRFFQVWACRRAQREGETQAIASPQVLGTVKKEEAQEVAESLGNSVVDHD